MAELDSKERQREIFAQIGKLIGEIAQLRNPDDDPILVGWVAAYEWTSVRLEQNDQYATGTVCAPEQSGSMARGLFSIGLEECSLGGRQ